MTDVSRDLLNLDAASFQPMSAERLFPKERSSHAPRVLLLYAVNWAPVCTLRDEGAVEYQLG